MPLSFLVTGGAITFAAWCYLLLARGGYWRVRAEGDAEAAPAESAESLPRIAAVIPARNEAPCIAEAIASLLHQSCAASLSIFLVDDGSSDGTAEIARGVAREQHSAATLTVINGKPLPGGWSGKLWTLAQGIERARETNPDFFLLTDADVVHAPDNVARLVQRAETGGYDLASFMVKLVCRTVPEKLLVPAFVYFFLKLYPPAWIADPKHRTAGAAGGCVLIRPVALERAGGLEAIRNEIIDDCALARAVRRSGGRIWLGLTRSAHSLRSYGTFAEIGRTIIRTAFSQLRHSLLWLLAAVLAMVVTYLLPPALLLTGAREAMILGAVAWMLMTLSYLPMVRFYGLRPWWALLLPLAALFYVGATVVSAVEYWAGHGGYWKGRVQDPVRSTRTESVRVRE